MTCNDIGIPLSFRPGRKFIPIPSLYLPTSFCIPLQWGQPVNVGGPLVPNFSLMALLKAFVFGCFLKVLGKVAGKLLKKLGSKLSGKTGLSGKLKGKLCKMGFEPVDLVTGRVNYSGVDFEIPGPISIQWTREWDSDATRDGMLGHGTHLCYDRWIELFPEEGALALSLADGRVAAFPLLQPGEEYYHRAEKLMLRRKENGHFFLDDFGAGLYFHFNHVAGANIFRLSFIENYSGYRIQFHYSGSGQSLQAMTDSAGRRLLLHYDKNRHIIRVEVRHKDIAQTLVSYAYNEEGDLTGITDAIGQTTQILYQDHLMVQKTDRNGVSFYWEYDQRRRCTHTWGDGGLLEGRLDFGEGYTAVVNGLGENTTYWYDENNLCVQETDHYGNHRATEYTDDFELYREIDELGNITGYVYDDRALVKEKIFPDNSSLQFHYNEFNQIKLIIGPDGNSESYGYDPERRLRFINYPNGKTIGYEYNDMGQLAAVIENGRQKTAFEYDADENLIEVLLPTGATAKWKYDALGRCLQTVNPEGQLRHYDYDALGRLHQLYLPDGNTIALEYNAYEEVTGAVANNGRVEFEYTPLGRLKKRKQNHTELNFLYDNQERLKAVVNEAGKHYRFGYNKRGEIVSETGFDGLQRQYDRDLAGKVTRVERPGRHHTTYEYDRSGRITRIERDDGSWEIFRYDRNGSLIEATNEHSTVKLIRNKTGGVETEWQGSYAVKSSYDKYGDRIGISSSLGVTIGMQRDGTGLPVSLNAGGGPGSEWHCRLRYNRAGREVERLLPGGIKSEWMYDPAGRPGERKVTRNGVRQSWKKYTWEAGDRLTRIFDALSQASSVFRQDVAGNLVFAQYADSDIVYRATDDTGNIYETRDRSDRKYSTSGALLESRGKTYRYDEEGNLVSRTEKTTGKTWRYRWLGGGLLGKVERPDGKTVCFKYDALGRRIEKTYDGQVTRFLWNGNVLLHEWTYPEKERPRILIDERGGIRPDREEPTHDLISWIFDADSFIPAAKIAGGKAYSIISDYLGTPQEMYDDSGKKVWEAALDIYGRVRTLAGERGDVPFRYQGQYEDTETGLYYNRFRYYSPVDGVYISQDPIGLNGGLVSYGYVRNPNEQIDPLGLMPWGGFMNGANADISNGTVTENFASSASGHAEINGLNSFADRGLLDGKDITLSNVNGQFNPGGTKPVGVCTNCRADMFKILDEGGAKSVTFPMTKGNKVGDAIKIPAEKFAVVRAELVKVRDGGKAFGPRSDEAWEVLEKHNILCR
jgi:RHS repeat-associated protein